MASQSFLPTKFGRGQTSLKAENLSKPLLSKLTSSKGKDSIKLSMRLRHCRSAPDLHESIPPLEVNQTRAPHVFQSHGVTFKKLSIGAVAFATYLGLGVACFYAMQEDLQGRRTNSFVDALYFCVVTMTTLGYGDLVPKGVPEKLLTCMYVFMGCGLVGWLLGSAADFLVERQEKMLVHALSGKNEYADFRMEDLLKKVRLKVAIAGAIFLVLFTMGLVVMVEVEGMGFVEAFYGVCVTVTTLGYGDITFQTTGGRAFAVVWILVSTVNVAQLFLYMAELYTEGRRQSVLQMVLTRKTTPSDLEAADIDDDGVVSAAEFVLYKLKEMGKIEEQDMVEILKEFDAIDVDESGTLSPYDLKLAEMTESS